jgi:DNA glycosylase AlkZ-like
VETADREHILAFRLESHNLTRRLGTRSLTKAAAACGIQETPLGSAAVALLARVEKLTPAVLDRAWSKDRTLVGLWAMRGAPYVIPSADLWVFTLGALPRDRVSFKQSLGGWADALEEAGLDPFETLDRMADAAKTLLDGTTMNVNDLRVRIYRRVRSLARVKRPAFTRDPMPEPLFRAVGTAGAACIVAGRGTDAELARTDQWLKTMPPRPDPSEARGELARRFLHCYGPATAQQFAAWTERSPADAKDALASIEQETVEVAVGGTKARLLARDQKTLASPPEASGTRLLPVQDPYLQQRDRATVLPKDADRRKLWQPVRGPGGVLVDGEIVATWRARTKGTRLEVTIEPLSRVSPPARDAIEAEAQRIAPFRGCETVKIELGK